MIHEEICTYEVCKLAKEKCFDIHCVPFYALEDFTAEYIDDIGEFYEVDFEKGYLYLNYPIKGLLHKEKMLPAPTQSLLQRWLREEKDIHISINYQQGVDEQCPSYDYSVYRWPINTEAFVSEEWKDGFSTYELALEDALKYALENLV